MGLRRRAPAGMYAAESALDPATVGWLSYVDSQIGALSAFVNRVFDEHATAVSLSRACQISDLEALRTYTDRVFDEHQKAVVLVQTQTEAQVRELNGTTAQLKYVDAVFTEHRRAIDGTVSGNAKAIESMLAEVEARLAQRNAQVDIRFADSQLAVSTAVASVERTAVNQQRAVEVALTQVEAKIQASAEIAAERVDGVRREATAAQVAHAAATGKEAAATEKRFENVNEFRDQMNDQAQRFMLREVAEARIDELRRASETAVGELRQQIGTLQQAASNAAGATAASQRATTLLITGVGAAIAVVVFFANYVFQ
jgi:hypothetical protein